MSAEEILVIFAGAVSFVIAGRFVLVWFWRRKSEYGVSLPEVGIDEPVFMGATSTRRAASDAVDLGECVLNLPMEQTTAWREKRWD